MKKVKFMSLEWFKLKVENSVDRVIASKIDKIIDSVPDEEIEEECNGATIKNVKFVNDQLTIIMTDGEILTKTEATVADFDAVNDADTMEQVRQIIACVPGKVERVAENEAIAKAEHVFRGVRKLEATGDFTEKSGSLYLNGIERSIPKPLVERFSEIIGAHTVDNNVDNDSLQASEEYISLKKFWLKCCLNPNAQSAEDLYEFLSHHKFKIDKHGNFYAYRRVVSLNSENKELVEFISNAYTKVKAIWKKSPANFTVILDDSKKYSIVESVKKLSNYTEVGNLKELYINLPDLQEKSYTSAHTGTEDYRVGSVIAMPRQNGNDSNRVSCSKGFHAASKAYDYSGFGDTPILVIINPIDVLAVPRGEVGKLRTCRWFFATTLDREEQFILDDDCYDVKELGDVFESYCNEDLKEYVHNSYAEEVQRHTFTLPEMSHVDIKNIVKSLKSMKTVLKDRVHEIV